MDKEKEMSVIIDGIEYQPVEQKVDQEREKAIEAMSDDFDVSWSEAVDAYNSGYRKVGEAVLFEVAYLYYMRRDVSKNDVDARYTITKKVVK